MVLFLGFSNSYSTEYLVENIGVIVDIYVQIGRIKVGVMLNCAEDYCRNDPTHLLGETVARNRVLQNAGWEIVQIPMYEWVVMMSSHDKRLYLQRKLKKFITMEIMEGKPSYMDKYLK
eukprot:TRINITY_DN36412_c0_g1_i1.p3 TRINITY_DN36412_c0_g1~~TRINITY_DN36412_c0_g1_i1.p3  ORF type:complete len:118 (-),score=23.42 TRINITY_DN36412_c0_g1_i1:89-442(-)